MALSFFKKRDIDEMDINDIPEEFINYFESLDDEGKTALIGQRRELADALGFSLEKNGADQEEPNVNSAQEDALNGTENMNQEAQTEPSDLSDSESDDSDLTTEPDDSADELSERIKINAYAGQKLDNILKAELARFSEDIKRKVEALEEVVFQYTLQNTFQMVFDETTADYRRDHSIKNIRGNYHRYDLYARLLFAQCYYKHNPGRIRFMCIDEGQDISVNEYRLIRDLNNNSTVFNIFGDVNQLMKGGRGISNWGELDKIIGTKKYYLNENYRNTNQITRFCNKSFEMDVKLTGVDGKNVREILRKDLETEFASLGVITERIALLLPRKVIKNRYLKKELLPETLKDCIDDKLEIGHITCMYVDEIKGIEFDKAYVVSKGMSKSEKYIAYTRALSELIIVVDEKIKG